MNKSRTPSRAPGPPVTSPSTTTSPSAVHTATAPHRGGSLGPVGLVLSGGVSVQFGAALAVNLMPRAGRRFPQADGLALAMAVGALLMLPLGIAESGSRLTDPTTIALGSAVAIMSSVLPYTLELLALRRLPASTFAIMMSLEPALAA